MRSEKNGRNMQFVARIGLRLAQRTPPTKSSIGCNSPRSSAAMQWGRRPLTWRRTIAS